MWVWEGGYGYDKGGVIWRVWKGRVCEGGLVQVEERDSI